MEHNEGERKSINPDFGAKTFIAEMKTELMTRVVLKWISEGVVDRNKFSQDMNEVLGSDEYNLWLVNKLPISGKHSPVARMKFLSEFMKETRKRSEGK